MPSLECNLNSLLFQEKKGKGTTFFIPKYTKRKYFSFIPVATSKAYLDDILISLQKNRKSNFCGISLVVFGLSLFTLWY